MVYVRQIKSDDPKDKTKQTTVHMFENKKSLDNIRANKPGVQISKNDSKGLIRGFLNSNASKLPGMSIAVSYFTDQGMVNLNKTVTVGDKLTEADIDRLMGDPKTNKDQTSGEYNNELEGKTIYGVAITCFKA